MYISAEKWCLRANEVVVSLSHSKQISGSYSPGLILGE